MEYHASEIWFDLLIAALQFKFVFINKEIFVSIHPADKIVQILSNVHYKYLLFYFLLYHDFLSALFVILRFCITTFLGLFVDLLAGVPTKLTSV